MTTIYVPSRRDNKTCLPDDKFRILPMEACYNVDEALAFFIRYHYDNTTMPKFKDAIDGFLESENHNNNPISIGHVFGWEEKSLKEGVRRICRRMTAFELRTINGNASVTPFAVSECAGLFYDHRCHRDHRREQTDAFVATALYIARKTTLWVSENTVEYGEELVPQGMVVNTTAAGLCASTAGLVEQFEEAVCDVYISEIIKVESIWCHDDNLYRDIKRCANSAVRRLLDNIENNSGTHKASYLAILDAYGQMISRYQEEMDSWPDDLVFGCLTYIWGQLKGIQTFLRCKHASLNPVKFVKDTILRASNKEQDDPFFLLTAVFAVMLLRHMDSSGNAYKILNHLLVIEKKILKDMAWRMTSICALPLYRVYCMHYVLLIAFSYR
ncbi:hypothetical protein BC936DRAFT_140873, partial [Jimgerdemannia flammicorona]